MLMTGGSDDKLTLRLTSRLQGFHRLMPNRVREVLLVSSLYDAFILEEDGQVSELIFKEYARLNMRYAPRVTRVPTAERALELLDAGDTFDLLITTMHLGDVDPVEFACQVKSRRPSLPITLLGYDNRELQELLSECGDCEFEHVFVWTGDARILLAIVKLTEDALNVDYDTNEIGVEVIILVDDSVHFVSSYLPMLYAELSKQSQSLIDEGLTLSHKMLRMRARPKILLARTYEDAVACYARHRGHILGIITDRQYPRGGVSDPQAGSDFARFVKADNTRLPILLQSTDVHAVRDADAVGAQFLHKHSSGILQQLRDFMLHSFGFGPFVFQLPDGTEVARAHDLRGLKRALETIPAASLKYHAERNHYSTWFKARTEFRLAAKLRPQRIDDYPNLEAMRRGIIETLDEFQRSAYQDIIADFDPETFDSLSTFARIGGGSLGGKARGLAFLNLLLQQYGLASKYDGVEVCVPPTAVIGTDYFDEFLESNDLEKLAQSDAPDRVILQAFVDAPLPAELVRSLMAFINVIDYPLAVRSSSLLEDSQYQPFAGVYETYMLANNDPVAQRRLDDLCTSIKLVYASTFSSRAKSYLAATPHRPEKERMAVILQKLVGNDWGERFYPCLSGITTSHNYYPFGSVRPDDGMAYIALGLGKTVAEGRGGLRVCPKYPKQLPQFSSVEDILENSQKSFYALRMNSVRRNPPECDLPASYHIEEADRDGALAPVASVYSSENHAIYDGTARQGMRIVSFANILKHKVFPLSEILCDLLSIGRRSMNAQVEIEFAVNLQPSAGQSKQFACLQMRPLAVARDLGRVDLEGIEARHTLCQSPRAMGNGRIEGIVDVICINPADFDRKYSVETAAAVGRLNAQLDATGTPFFLIGPGRWGSSDPWLGIPVDWGQISGVRLIVETGFAGLRVTPSEGSHFFHNMTSFHVGYMTTNPEIGEGTLDWDWLLDQPVITSGENGLRWIRLREPALGLIDGREGTGVILKSQEAGMDIVWTDSPTA
ncbi:MAG: hypothetical protein KAS72_14230 [Phycisphaerales bacterium]|nr:hypothetical protein [Phycisphaerales bacterium]